MHPDTSSCDKIVCSLCCPWIFVVHEHSWFVSPALMMACIQDDLRTPWRMFVITILCELNYKFEAMLYDKIKRYSCLDKPYLHTVAYIFVITSPFATTSNVISLLKTASKHWYYSKFIKYNSTGVLLIHKVVRVLMQVVVSPCNVMLTHWFLDKKAPFADHILKYIFLNEFQIKRHWNMLLEI